MRYARWIDSRRVWVLVVALAVAAVGAILATRLSLRTEVSSLLPPDQESVRDLKALQKRVRAFGTVFVVVEADDPALRQSTVDRLVEALRALGPDLVANVTSDDRAAREYFWNNRFLFVDLDDLREARKGLADKIKRAKLEANPLYVSLDDDEDAPGAADVEARLDKLRERLKEAEEKAAKPAPFVSKDKRLQFLVLRTPFPTSDITLGKRLGARIHAIIDGIQSELGSRVRFGVTGTVTVSVYEHESILRGMALAAAITILLCAVALFWYYRSGLPVLSSLWALAVGVLATFAFTKLAIGHLNLMTAFLIAIVVGNGINAGLILLSRYFEVGREAEKLDEQVLALAIAGAARGTLAASLTAGAAYGSLIVTDFRGFRHFGMIAGVGMVLCWASAFTVLPAALSVLRRRRLIKLGTAPKLGAMLVRILPRRRRVAITACLVVALVAAVVSARYLLSDPFLEDWRDLQSKDADIETARGWDARMKNEFDRKYTSGLATRFAIGLDRRESVRPLVEKLQAIEAARPKGQGVLAQISSIYDYLPKAQDEKLALLDQIRKLLDDNIVEQFTEDERAELERIRPPEQLRKLTIADVPEALAWPYIEKNGTVGRIILARGNARFKTWNVDDRVEFAKQVRQLDLPPDAVLGGQSFVIADIIESMEHDGPLAIVVALIGSILVVFAVVGFGRHAAVTLICGAGGILVMIALCAIAGIRVHFLDLIALPITIGIGIDYSVNLAARDRGAGGLQAERLLSTVGGAVMLCSFTTIVGYGSLLLSSNGGIRSFGYAALLGEIACVGMALTLAPALLDWLRSRSATRSGGG